MKNIAVMKFGGSSLATRSRIIFVTHKIEKFLIRYSKIIVVLSAPADITDNLIKLSEGFKPDKNSCDMLCSCGEIISISLAKMAANKINLNSTFFNHYQLKIRAKIKKGGYQIISSDIKLIKKAFKKYDVIFVPGFIALDSKNNTITLGRGGSDYTAVYFANEFKADCYLLSDIDGIYTSNPLKIEYAKKLERVSYKELEVISKIDSEVRQTNAIKWAKKFNLKLYLGSSLKDIKPTLIQNYGKEHIPSVKYISVDNKISTKFYLVGEKISKRKDIINYINELSEKIKISRDLIEIDFTKKLSPTEIKTLYFKLINF